MLKDFVKQRSMAAYVQLLLLTCFFSLPFDSYGHNPVHIPPLLVISFDGFRHDYIYRSQANLSSFQKIKKEGVFSRNGLKNVFPTNTIPNHWSLVTGLYPESHGVMDNDIKSPDITKKFVPMYRDENYRNDPRYYDDGGEPIWVTNELQTHNGRSGVVMWYGAENPVKAYRPSLHMPLEQDLPYEKRVDTIVEWMTLPKHAVNLGLLYFGEPDHTAHKAGLDSQNVTSMISRINDVIGYLFIKLEEKDFLDDVNIIFVSDHGMTNVSRSKLIHLDQIVDKNLYEIVGYTPLAGIWPKEGQYDTVLKKLSDAAARPDSHFKVYTKDNFPERFHYKNNRRTAPILAVADLHYSFITNWTDEQFKLLGGHGYDNEFQDMHPFFMAMGPSFKPGASVDSFSTVDVYPMLCHLLHIKPAPNNGSLVIVSELFREGHGTTMWTFGTYVLVLIVIASIGGVFSVSACRQHRYLKRKIIQLRLSPMNSSIKYSIPPTGDAKTRLLSDEDDDEFDDANDDDEHILEIVGRR